MELDFTNQSNPLEYVTYAFKDVQEKANNTNSIKYIHGYLMPKTLRFLWNHHHIRPFKRKYKKNGLYDCTFRILPK